MLGTILPKTFKIFVGFHGSWKFITVLKKSLTLVLIPSQINSVHPHPNLFKITCQYYPPLDADVFQVASYPQVSTPETCMQISPYMPHIPPISFFWANHLITSGAMSSTPLLPPPVLAQTSSSTPYCRTPSAYGLRSLQRNVFSRPYKTAGEKHVSVYINPHMFGFQVAWKDKIFWTKLQQKFSVLDLLLILHERNFDLLMLFPNIWTLPHFQKIYCPPASWFFPVFC